MRLQTLLAAALLLAAAQLLAAPPAPAIPIFFSWGEEQIVKVADSPDTAEFEVRPGRFLDLGYKFKQVKIFFVPVWNYDGQLCGYIGSNDRYLKLNRAQLAGMAASAGVELPDRVSLPFWDSFGGKLVILGLFALFVLHGRSSQEPISGEPTDVLADEPR